MLAGRVRGGGVGCWNRNGGGGVSLHCLFDLRWVEKQVFACLAPVGLPDATIEL